MRKLIVGLSVAAVLATAAPAMAQLADTLGLIASGALVPFVGTGGAISPLPNISATFLEVESPVDENPALHMLLYNASCVRTGDSVGIPTTRNGLTIQQLDNLPNGPSEGLAAIGLDNGPSNLSPIRAPIFARGLWFDITTGFVRTFEPISIWNPETAGQVFVQETFVDPFDFIVFPEIAPWIWNPVRSGAAFFAPPEGFGGVFNTTIYFVCPTQSVSNSPASSTTGAFPTGNGFPLLLDTGGNAMQPSSTSLFFRTYDGNERFLRDYRSTCSCLTAKPLSGTGALNPVFSLPEAAGGTYTEVRGDIVAAATPAVCDFTDAGFVRQVTQNASKAQPDCSKFVAQADGPILPGCTDTGTAACNIFDQFKVLTPAVQAGGPMVFTGYKGTKVNLSAIGLGLRSIDWWGRLSNANYTSLGGTDGFVAGDVPASNGPGFCGVQDIACSGNVR